MIILLQLDNRCHLSDVTSQKQPPNLRLNRRQQKVVQLFSDITFQSACITVSVNEGLAIIANARF